VTTELIADPLSTPALSRENLLLDSKFVPPAAPHFSVARPGLVRRLEAAVDKPITLITGPAGSGKTQLAASWAAGRTAAGPVAWITLENDDDQPSTFWTYVVESLRRAGSATFPPMAPLVPAASMDRAVLRRLATALCAEPEPIVLVLDEVSLLSGRQWAADLEFVLRHAGGRLRLVLVGRWDPPLPLHRYRLAGQLTEVRSADLAFTADEAAHLLAMHDVALTGQGLATLLEHTEGWAAGLRLCASALQGRADAEEMVATISGDETTIAEYFVGEVLRMQPPEVRRFLLETSVLGTFTPEVAEALTGRTGARRMLTTLTRENAFVRPVGSGIEAYRYHRLFAELLRAQLVLEEPDHVPRLHRRAAALLAGQGLIGEAVGHATAAGDWGAAASIVVDDYAIGRLVIDGTRSRLGAYFRRLPDVPDQPAVALVQAALELAAGHADRCADRLAQAGRLLAGRATDAQHLACALLGILIAGAGAGTGPLTEPVLQSIRDAEAMLALAPTDRVARHPELAALLHTAKGTELSRSGLLTQAVATLTVAATAVGCERPRIDALRQLALIEAYRGRLNRAEVTARQALDLAARCGLERENWPAAAELALAWVAVERFDVEAADHHLRTAQPQAGPGSDGLTRAAYALVKARRLQVRGELRGAARTLHESTATPDRPAAPEWLSREVALAEARMMIVDGRFDGARAVLGRHPGPRLADVAVVRATLLLAEGQPGRAHEIARTVADAVGVTAPVAVEAWLLLAMIAAQAEDTAGVREALRRALRVAAPEALRRPVYQVWNRLRRAVRDDDDLAVRYRALGGMDGPQAASGPEPATPVQPVVVEALSKREMEVLGGMAEMLPTEEIAASMFVSVNTVKTHVRSILRKLGASRRNEAVRRARSLKLI
jgi:LuxR family transcriptional regulator, maltose regulon positive regulatory protein